MVTQGTYVKNGKFYNAVTLYGLSTDNKPTNVGNGSVFFEIDNFGKSDTPYIYMFDGANSVWYPSTQGGGS